MSRGGAASLGLSACIACIPSDWGLVLPTWKELISAWETVLSAWEWVPSWESVLFTWEELLALTAWWEGTNCLGGATTCLGRIVYCLGNSAVCLGLSPQLGISTVYLRGVASPDCLRRSANCLGEPLPAWETVLESLCLALYPRRLLMDFTLAWRRPLLIFW